ncbi:MAG: zinc ABC transporter substrate-binding protein [Hyphomicrobiaceae bacterium]
MAALKHWIAGPLSAAFLCLTGNTGALAEPKVVATIKPIHALVAGVMAGVGEPKLLIDGAGSPHTFTLKPSDARALNQSDMVFRVSDILEPFMIKVLTALPKSVRVITLEDAPGLTLHKMRSGATFEQHTHDHGPKGRHVKKADAHDHHDHGKPGKSAQSNDGHIWLDPANAKVITQYIASVLATEAPEHAARFKENADAVSRSLDQLDVELRQTLKPIAGRPYIVFHDAYHYLEGRYGLTAAGAVTVSPEIAPSAKRLSELRKKISTLKAVCVFAEPQFEPKLVRTITEGTSARTGTLDYLGASLKPGPDLYFNVLRSLAADLKACLSNPS